MTDSPIIAPGPPIGTLLPSPRAAKLDLYVEDVMAAIPSLELNVHIQGSYSDVIASVTKTATPFVLGAVLGKLKSLKRIPISR